MAMLLGRIKRNVIATVRRLDGTGSKGENEELQKSLQFVFAVPPSYPEATRHALVDAAYAASVSDSRVIDSTACMASVYERKLGDAISDNETKVVVIIDMGHARTCVSVLKLGGCSVDMAPESMDIDTTEESSAKEEEKKCKEPNEEKDNGEKKNFSNAGSKVQVLSTICSPTLGAGIIDVKLYHHFLSTHPSFSDAKFAPNSRAGQRLLEGCRKLKHLLSMLPDGDVTVENIGNNECDVSLSASRGLLQQLCKDEVVGKLKCVIQSAIQKAGGTEVLKNISVVEVTGGGCRIPMIQDAIRDMLDKGYDFAFSRSLDDTSLALGAAMMASSSLIDSTIISPSFKDLVEDAERAVQRAKLLQDEIEMEQRDVQLLRKDEIRNQIEAHILELRSAKHSSPHSSLLPDSDEFNAHLDGTDDWLFSEECEVASIERLEEIWTNVQSRTRELCGEYLSAKQAEAEKKDREMEEEARRASVEQDAEAAMNGEDNDVEDHDTRRLPTKRRMEIVMKNKAEANELFSDGNYRHAAARYAKALTHCTKFYDLSPQEEHEVKEVKLSLYLNMAFAYIKLEKLDNAYQSCNDALAIDEANVKALYRRASVQYQKRKFDDALKDLKMAEKLSPEDKAVQKLRRMVDQQVAKQKAKEKAMAKKMFGS